MKLNDLRDGMVVTYRNGGRRTVEGEDLQGKDGSYLYDFRNSYSEDLIHGTTLERNQERLDIMKVEVPSSVWEREEISKEQQEITDIREQMEKLATRLKQLEGCT